jgi:hypothetical protein
MVKRRVVPSMPKFADGEGNADTYLDLENVVLSAAQRAVLVHVSVQVDVVDSGEVPQKILLQAIQAGNELTVGYVADDLGLVGKTINSPSEESDIVQKRPQFPVKTGCHAPTLPQCFLHFIFCCAFVSAVFFSRDEKKCSGVQYRIPYG